ncbi:hypothetical protein F5884DRAFT_671116 [Xylogone sp. PMI_703]|nr:hypothetical protein F5884DRAFT_671116 [Xylogone sp. PMI_703]
MLQYQSIGRRRNGKQQACEPCRKGKMACDHSVPFCGRCVRRKMTSACIYHPAPMTRPKPTAGPELVNGRTGFVSTPDALNSSEYPSHMIAVTETATNLPNMENVGYSDLRSSKTLNTPPCEDTGRQRTLSEIRYANEGSNTIISPGSSGSGDTVVQRSSTYHGPTSFLAVFNEHRAKFQGDLLDVGEYGPNPSDSEFGESILGTRISTAPSTRIDFVVKALQNIPPKEVCQRLIDTFDCILYDISLNEIMIRHCNSSIWSSFEAHLQVPRTPDQLGIIAKILFKNEGSPLLPAPVDGLEWLNTITGFNMRLEVLGLLFCFFGLAFLSLQERDPALKAPGVYGRNRKEAAWRMKECAGICLKMCECTDTVNEFVAALTISILVLESTCLGDEDYSSRRRHADMITTTIAAGLHRIPDSDPSQATPATEYRRRVFCSIYHIDKVHCSLTGVPPGLTRLYCHFQLPLDLDDNELFGPRDGLALAVTKLDSNGWNTQGNFSQVTSHRVISLLAPIREEILEISLGINVHLTTAGISDLHRRCQEIYTSAPEQAKYYDGEGKPKPSTGKLLLMQAVFMLEFLQCRFLIDRVAVSRGLTDGQTLLDVSMEIMDITNMFWLKRDLLLDFYYQFDWFVTCYGVPSAGVICVELLKQSKKPSQSSLRFSRSDAIQKLMMFKGFLEWIRPTHGNYKLATRLNKVIGRIMDHVLEEREDSTTRNDQHSIPPESIFPPLDEADCMDWLNGIDWTQGPWMEFNQIPP